MNQEQTLKMMAESVIKNFINTEAIKNMTDEEIKLSVATFTKNNWEKLVRATFKGIELAAN